jgi:hypothetical protein
MSFVNIYPLLFSALGFKESGKPTPKLAGKPSFDIAYSAYYYATAPLGSLGSHYPKERHLCRSRGEV